MNEKLDKALKKIDQLSLRERVLILVTSLVVVYIVWDSLVFSWINGIKRQLAGDASQLQQRISALQGQITQVSSSLSLDPVIRLKEKIRKSKEENQELQDKLVTMTAQLIPPKAMTSLLQSMLDSKSLKIIKVENLTPMPVLNNSVKTEGEEEEADQEAATMQVYQHGIEVVLSGTFFQILKFLQEAEKMSWKILWEELEFTVVEYPAATIRIVFKTLSIEPHLLSS